MTPIEYFKEICAIPHGSGNEEAIAKYIECIAKKHGLFCFRDTFNNVFVRKSATAGYEYKNPVLFAAHTDMVCEKLPLSPRDFLTDPIELIEKNGKLYANGTTLGGDDGAGVAIMLSLMTDDALIAPVTEYLFTTAEETGMDGAIGFDYSSVLSDMVINLDTGWENGVCISCASGYRYDLKIPLDRTRKYGKAVKLSICGLAGGHSGVEISNGLHSANKLLGSLLDTLYSTYPFHIVDVTCDGKANVIAPSAEATVIFYDSADEKQAKAAVSDFEKGTRALLSERDKKKFRVTFKKLNAAESEALPDMLTLKSSSAVISALTFSPQGVLEYFPDKSDIMSSVNLGIIKTDADTVTFSYLARSASEFSDKRTRLILERLAHVLGASLELSSYHTCWEYSRGSCLQTAYEKAYASVFSSSPEFFATHAGLECGTFYGKLRELEKSPDIISIGPNMYDIHTPKEALEIASVDRIYEATKALLKIICE